MKKILWFIFVFLSFYVFLNYIFSDTNLLNNILFNDLSIINSKNSNEALKEINNIVIRKQNEKLIKMLTLYENNESIKVNLVIPDEPLIYIYNTHDKESYANPDSSLYNIDCNVKTASYILQDKLLEYNITSIVEERSPTNEVSKNKQDYPYTYSYSRKYLEEAIKRYPSIKIFIDLHRDGVSKEVSTTVINGKNYAKLMFFLGLGHEKSDQNKILVKALESIIEKKYDGILRNTFIRPNDSYNQDLSPNSFLLEVGGNYNTIEEVYNSLDVLAYALYTYLGDV